MNDPSGVPSALGIEAVECFSEGGSTLTVRVTGRWRRRRPDFRGQAMLVVEAQGTRHRFPAMPEPPSLVGTLPGTWRMSFSVPAELGPHLGERTWLALGAVVVPLPVTVEAEPRPAAEESRLPAEPDVPPAPEPPDIEGSTPRELGGSGQTLEAARRRAAEAETKVAELALKVEALERDLEDAREEPDQLRAMLANRERERRIAEQRVHAERSLRQEVEEELAHKGGEDPTGQATAAAHTLQERVDELEHELERVRREAAEAQNLAAAATAARSRAELEVAELAATTGERPPPRAEKLSPALRAERLLSKASQDPSVVEAATRVAQRSAAQLAARVPGAGAEREMVVARRKRSREPELEAMVAELRGERNQLERDLEQARASAEQEAAELQRVRERSQRDVAELEEMRERAEQRATELGRAQARARQEAAAHAQAGDRISKLERELVDLRGRCVRAYQAITEIRAQLSELRLAPPAPPAPEAPPTESEASPSASEPQPGETETAEPEREVSPQAQAAGAVEAQRLSAALARLRDTAPSEPDTTQAPEPGPRPAAATRATNPWLSRVYRELLRRDPMTAGRLLIALLPAQRKVAPQPLAYDLILGELACVQVTVGKDSVAVEHRDEPRPVEQVHFQVRGDLASVARRVAAGRIRRRLGRRLARVSGERARFAALKKLVDSPLALRELLDAGVQFDPALTFTIVSLMVDSRWTVGERFTIAHQATEAGPPGAYLNVRSGSPLLVSDRPPQRPVATTIVSQSDALLAVVAGERPPDVFIRGEAEPLELLQQWLERAQSG